MAVVIETTLGDFTVDLFTEERPRTSLNFLKLCKIKYYNFCLFHTVQHNFIAQTGDPTGTGKHGESVFSKVYGEDAKYYEAEQIPKLKHTKAGLLSMVGCGNNMLGSQFFITLGDELQSLDGEHCVFGEITEGFEILLKLNEAICDNDHRPYRDIRITHTIILEDPFDDISGLPVPDASPLPTDEILANGRIAADEEIDETRGKSLAEVEEFKKEREAKAQATILEIVGDIPDADIAPPENVLFVCKLNPVTNDDDLEIIFSRFGKIKSCEVIRDKKTGESLQYAFIEFEEKKSCEDAYFKMDNVLIDDRRIHVDFSQSVAKLRWKGKGRGVEYIDAPSRSSAESTGSKSKKHERLKNGDDVWEPNNLHGSRSSSYTNHRSSSFDKKDDRSSTRDRRRRDSAERDCRPDRKDARKPQDRSKREDSDRRRDGSLRRNDNDRDRRRTDKRSEDTDRDRNNDRRRDDSNHDKLKHERRKEETNHDRYRTSKSTNDLREKYKSNRNHDELESERIYSNRACDMNSEISSKYRKDKVVKEVSDNRNKDFSKNSESHRRKSDDDYNKKQNDLESVSHFREKVGTRDVNCKSLNTGDCPKTENIHRGRKRELEESEKLKKSVEKREEKVPCSSKDYLLSKKRKHSDSHEEEICKFSKADTREILRNNFSDIENVESRRKSSNTTKEIPVEDGSEVVDSRSNNNRSRQRKSSSVDSEKKNTSKAKFENTVVEGKHTKLSDEDIGNDSKVDKSVKKEDSSDESDNDSNDKKKLGKKHNNVDNDNGKEMVKSKGSVQSKKVLKEVNSAKGTKKRKNDDSELNVKKKKHRRKSSSSSSGSEISDSEDSSSDSESSSSDYVHAKIKKHSKKRMRIPKKMKKKKLKHEKIKKRVRYKSPSSESDSSSSDSSYDEKRHRKIKKKRKKHKSDSSSDDSSLDRMIKRKRERKKKSKQKRKALANSDSDDNSTSSSESASYVSKKRPKKIAMKKVQKSKKQLNKKKKNMSKKKTQKSHAESSSELSEDSKIKNSPSKKISTVEEKRVNKKPNSASDSSD